MNINKPYDNQINLLMGITDNTVNPFPVGIDPASNRVIGDNYPDITKSKLITGPKAFPWLYQSFKYDSDDAYPVLDKNVYRRVRGQIDTAVIQSDGGNIAVNSISSGYIGVFRARFYNSVGGVIQLDPNCNGSIAIYNNNNIVNKVNNETSQLKTYLTFSVGWNNIEIYTYSSLSSSSFSLGVNFTDFAEYWEVGGTEPVNPPSIIVLKNNRELLGKRDSNAVNIEWNSTFPDKTKEYIIYRRGPFITGMPVPALNISASKAVDVSGVNGVYSIYYDNSINLSRDPMYYVISAVYSGLETAPSEPILLAPRGAFYGPEYIGVTSIPDPSGLLSLDTPYTYLVTASNNNIDLLGTRSQVVSLITSEYSTSIDWSEVPGARFYKILRASGVVGLDYFVNGSGQLLDTVTGVFEYIDSGVFSGVGLYSGLNIIPASGLLNISMSRLDSSFVDGADYGTNSFYLEWTIPTSGIIPDGFNIYRSVASGIYDNLSYVCSIPYMVSGVVMSGYVDSNIQTGVDVSSFTPKTLVQVSRPDRNTFSYVDSNLKNKAVYEYRVAAVNYIGIEGDTSSPVYVTAGDTVAPAMPSGVSINTLGYEIGLNWINGKEEDYLATNVYYSSVETGVYEVIRKIDGQFTSIPLGYGSTGYFKLSNIDLNDNESPLTSVITGITNIAGFISGVGPSSDSAVALWNGTNADSLKNSNLFYDGGTLSGLYTLQADGSSSLSLAGANLNLNTPGNINLYADANNTYSAGIGMGGGYLSASINGQISLNSNDGLYPGNITLYSSNTASLVTNSGAIALATGPTHLTIDNNNGIDLFYQSSHIVMSGATTRVGVNNPQNYIQISQDDGVLINSDYGANSIVLYNNTYSGVVSLENSIAGVSSKLELGWSGAIRNSGSMIPFDSGIYDIGSPSYHFRTLYVDNVSGIVISSSTSGLVTSGEMTGYLKLTGGTMSNNIVFPGGFGITSAGVGQTLNVSASSGVSIGGGAGSIVISNSAGGVQVAGNNYLQLTAVSGDASLSASHGNIILVCNTTGTVQVFSDIYTTGHIRPTVTNTKDLGNLGLRWANVFATNVNGSYFSSNSTENVSSRDLTTFSSGSLSVGSSGLPFGSGYFKNAYITNLHGLSPINLYDHLVPSSSGIIDLGSSTARFRTLYVDSLSGVTLGTTYSGISPISVSGANISITSGSASQNGYISSGDWASFNSRASGNFVPVTGGTLSGNLSTSASGVNLLGASGVPFSGVWTDRINGVKVSTIVFSEVPTGDVDGANNIYRTVGQILNNDCLLFKNGIAQTPTVDYTQSVSTITMATPPPVNSKMLVHYQYNTPTVPLAWDANVIGAWELKTNSLDGTTNARNLTIGGAAESFTTLAGKTCPTIFFSRGGAYVTPYLPELSGTNIATIEFEMYHNSNDTREIGITDSLNFYSMQMSTNTASYFNNNNVYLSLVANPGLNTWFSVAMVKNATRQKVYINNALVANIAATWNFGGNPRLWIGWDWYDFSYVDCSIRNVVLSKIERTSFPTTKV